MAEILFCTSSRSAPATMWSPLIHTLVFETCPTLRTARIQINETWNCRFQSNFGLKLFWIIHGLLILSFRYLFSKKVQTAKNCCFSKRATPRLFFIIASIKSKKVFKHKLHICPWVLCYQNQLHCQFWHNQMDWFETDFYFMSISSMSHLKLS